MDEQHAIEIEQCEMCGIDGVRTERPGELPEGADLLDELLCVDENGDLLCDLCAVLYKEGDNA